MSTLPSGQVSVSSVLPGSAAAQAGLLAGDHLISVAGQAIGTAQDVINTVGVRSVGDTVPVVITRAGQQQTINVTLGTRPNPGQVMQSFVSRAAPAFQLANVDGSGDISLAQQQGRVTLVYFWSVWCPACRLANPSLTQWHQTMSARGLTILGVASDPLPDVRQALAASPFPFATVHDPDSKTGGDYWVSGVPSFFVIDRSGVVTHAASGWDQSQGAALAAELNRLLGP